MYKIIFTLIVGILFSNPSWALVNNTTPHGRFFQDRGLFLQHKVANNDATWTRFKTYIESDTSGGTYSAKAWEYAVAYIATGSNSYKTTAITIADAIIAAGYSGARNDSYLYAYSYVKDIAVVYDIFYSDLTPSQRTSYLDFMEEIVWETWNPSLTAGPHATAPGWSGWGLNNPLINYHYSHLLATAYYVYSAYGTRDCDTYATILRNDLSGAVTNTLNSVGKGGGWLEGANYGEVTYNRMFELFEIVRMVDGVNYFIALPFFKESVIFSLNVMMPGDSALYPAGDMSRISYQTVSDMTRMTHLFRAWNLNDYDEGKYSQYFLAVIFPDVHWHYIIDSYDFLYFDASKISKNYKYYLQKSYFAEGAGIFFSRSGWNTSDSFVSLSSINHRAAPQHAAQNKIIVWKNDFQVIDANSYTSSGINHGTEWHSTVMIGDVGQEEYYINNTVKILNNSAGSKYAYASGSATGAYASVMVDYKRELLHIYPDIVFVADRIFPTNSSANRKILYQFHNLPAISSNILYSTNGAGKVTLRMAVPSLPDPTIVNLKTIKADFSSYRAEYASTSGNLFITGMALDNTIANKSYSITSISGTSCAGISLTDAISRWNAVFGNTYSPGATDTISFTSPSNGATQYYYISNLQPSQTHYYKQLDNRDGTFTTTISNSAGAVSGYTGTFTSDSAGVGNFGDSKLIPAPPSRINISGRGFSVGENGIYDWNAS